MLTYYALQYGFVWVLMTHLIYLGLGVGFAYSVVMQAASSVSNHRRLPQYYTPIVRLNIDSLFSGSPNVVALLSV